MQHTDALEATIAASPVLSLAVNTAVVTLARTLAEQMDEAGAEASTRLSAAYLSVLKDLHRVIATSKATPTSSKTATLRKMREGAPTLKAVK